MFGRTLPGEDWGDHWIATISSLWPTRGPIPVVEDSTQRQMQVMNENFPMRPKAEAEQLHNGVSMNPVEILEQFTVPPLVGDAINLSQDEIGTSLLISSISSSSPSDQQFNDTTIFYCKVTQASRACRSIEVIVQARWVEHFEAYVEHLKAHDPRISSTRHRKTALVEAASNFGWKKKELRNKMAAAPVFAGIGIYLIYKYRIRFDNESMQRLCNLRPALEVAADTMNPTWRRLLSVISKPSETVSPPIPVRKMYLQWDPHFNYRHIDESMPSSEAPLTRVSSLFVCEMCSNEQSDDLKVFRTPDGRNNGLMALCAFEWGAAVGELITKGLQDVDVMENSTGSTNYKIWQGSQGNFTRFVNHSCNANAQYRRLTWLDTQRIILVGNGIDSESEITVDYSDKYWKGGVSLSLSMPCNSEFRGLS
ncbi:hypothetical protein F4679DRAFT_576793 [Xylaria curta]|nr:hypothetical protein F4679DRAFT_576793 [Xylaria curta]